jgi:putative toxin-antitoxin system antitoxin component (TIGR02293 family)
MSEPAMSESAQDWTTEPVAIAKFMRLRRPDTYTSLKLANSVADGFPVHSVEAVCKRIDPTGQRLSIYDVVAKPTYHRKKQERKPLSKDDSEKLWQIARVYVEAMRHYRDDDDAVAFLFRPHPLIEGRRPIDLAKESAAGAALVVGLLAEAEAGVAV